MDQPVLSLILHWQSRRPQVVLGPALSWAPQVLTRGVDCVGRQVVDSLQLYNYNMPIVADNERRQLPSTITEQIYLGTQYTPDPDIRDLVPRGFGHVIVEGHRPRDSVQGARRLLRSAGEHWMHEPVSLSAHAALPS
jgi:hypothetical protein